MEKQGLFASEFIFASCGDFDGNQMKREASHKLIKVPNYLKRWINVKKAFPLHLYDKEKLALDFTNPSTIGKCKAQTGGMPNMLKTCKLELEGKHHSGIDDARNIARCVIDNLEKGYEFT